MSVVCEATSLSVGTTLIGGQLMLDCTKDEPAMIITVTQPCPATAAFLRLHASADSILPLEASMPNLTVAVDATVHVLPHGFQLISCGQPILHYRR